MTTHGGYTARDFDQAELLARAMETLKLRDDPHQPHDYVPWNHSVLLVTLVIILICLNLVFLAAFVLMWKRRKLQPLMFRAPILTLIISVSAATYFTWIYIKLLAVYNPTVVPESFLCPSFSWITWIAYPTVVVSFSVRAYRLWRVFRATEDRYNELSTQNDESSDYLINATAAATSSMTAAAIASSGIPSTVQTPTTSTGIGASSAFGGSFTFSPHQSTPVAPQYDSTGSPVATGYARIPVKPNDSPRSRLAAGEFSSSPLMGGTPSSTSFNNPLLMSAQSKKAQFVEKQVLTERTMLKWLAVTLVGAIALKAMLQAFNLEEGLGFGCKGSIVAIIPLIFNIIQLALGAFLLFVFRHIKDDYGAAREVTLISGMWVAATVIEIIALMIATASLPTDWADMNARTYGVVHGICHLLRALFILGTCGIWPLYQTYTTQFVSLWSDYSSLHSLDALLYDMVCLNYFHAFLLNEQMSADYLSCWMEIELYNELALSLAKAEIEEEGLTNEDIDKKARYFPQLRLHAMRIFNRYIAPGCEKELKLITEATRQRLVSDLNLGLTNHHTFDRVQGECYAVMNSCFPRFKSSIYHRKCLADLDRDEQLRSVLEKSGMIDSTSQLDI